MSFSIHDQVCLGGVIPRPDGKGGSYHGSWYRDATGAWWPYLPQLVTSLPNNGQL